jgi:hypothetical protein
MSIILINLIEQRIIYLSLSYLYYLPLLVYPKLSNCYVVTVYLYYITITAGGG